MKYKLYPPKPKIGEYIKKKLPIKLNFGGKEIWFHCSRCKIVFTPGEDVFFSTEGTGCYVCPHVECVYSESNIPKRPRLTEGSSEYFKENYRLEKL